MAEGAEETGHHEELELRLGGTSPLLLEGPTLITTDLWKRNRTPLLMHQVPGQTELLQGLALSEVVWQSEHTWSL